MIFRYRRREKYSFRVHCWLSLPEAWLEAALAVALLSPSSLSSPTRSLSPSTSNSCNFGFFISDMSRKAEKDDCFNWMIVFVHGWYVGLCSVETTGFFGTSWRTSQPYWGTVAKNLMRSSSSGLEFSSDSIDWRLKISQYLEFATFNWWGNKALALYGHKFSISLFKSSKESKLSPSCARSQFDMPESVGIFKVDDTKNLFLCYERLRETIVGLRQLTTLLQSAIVTFWMKLGIFQWEGSTSICWKSIRMLLDSPLSVAYIRLKEANGLC